MSIRHASVSALGLTLVLAACAAVTGPTGQPAASQAPTDAPATVAPASAAPTAEAPATSAPATEGPATSAPATDLPATADPNATLDPSQSDAGIVGRVTIPNDTREDRRGTHTIIGREGHGFGTGCEYTFEGDRFIAVAWDDDAQNGSVWQMSVSVPTDSMPANDGELRIDITNGVAYVDFRSESGIGTAYTGDGEDDNGSSSIDIAVSGDIVTFDFEATTWDDIDFFGQVVCQGVEL